MFPDPGYVIYYFFYSNWRKSNLAFGAVQGSFIHTGNHNLIMLINSLLLKHPSDSTSTPCLVHRPSLDVTPPILTGLQMV